MYLSMLSPRGDGGRANHGILIKRSFPTVGILIVHDVPRVGEFDMVAILFFSHLGKYPDGIWMSFMCLRNGWTNGEWYIYCVAINANIFISPSVIYIWSFRTHKIICQAFKTPALILQSPTMLGIVKKVLKGY